MAAIRMVSDERGFTLIELMVVLICIGILIAIAVPTFLGARSRAQNRAVEENLVNTVYTERTAYAGSASYVSASSLSSYEPSLSFVSSSPTAGGKDVAVLAENDTVGGATVTGTTVCAWALSSSGTYYGTLDIAQAGSTYSAVGTLYYSGTSAPTCTTYPSSLNTTRGAGWAALPTLAGW